MLSVGDRVFVRARPWRVAKVRPAGTGSVLELRALDDEQPTQVTVVSPPDLVEVLAPDAPRLEVRAIDSYRSWLDAHQLVRLTAIQAGGLSMGAQWGRVQLSEYQLEPVRALLDRPRPSLLLADDVGLGKTIEAGLVVLELLARRRARRILIATPAGLVQQWREELHDKFRLDFHVLADAGDVAAAQSALPAGLNPWVAYPLILTSLDFVKRLPVRRRALAQRFDLVIVDEAHALATSGSARSPRATHRTRLGHALRDNARGLLLLTATPHNGHAHSFLSLLDLVDPAQATLSGNESDKRRRVARTMLRRMKSEIVVSDESGRSVRRFPKREVKGIAVTDSDAGYLDVLAQVSAYCSKTARDATGSGDAELVGFAMQIVKKRALSSRRALERTLSNRIDALAKVRAREERPERSEMRDLQLALPVSENHAERAAQRILRSAIPSDEKRRKAELRKLKAIDKQLGELPPGDPKVALLLDHVHRMLEEMPDEKVIVFTEYRDTLDVLTEALETSDTLRGRWVTLHGGLSPRQRREKQQRFEGSDVRVLLATDAASEGLNLQRTCCRVIHFELPWNPNRLEQRNGRVDRYGQSRRPVIRYLYHAQSPEEDVLHQLVTKIESISESRVSTPDILGLVDGLDDLEAGLVDLDPGDGEIEARKSSLVRTFDDRASEFERDLRPLLACDPKSCSADEPPRDALSADPLLPDDRSLEAIAARLLGPQAMKTADRPGLWSIELPVRWRGPNVAASYRRATFLRSLAVELPDVEFLTPFHPLVQELLRDARKRLIEGSSDAPGLSPRRLALCPVASSEPPALVFTYLGSIEDGISVAEEPLLAVAIAFDGTVLDVPLDEPVPGSTPRARLPDAADVLAACEAHYEPLRLAADLEVHRRLGDRASALRATRAASATELRRELDRDLTDREFDILEQSRRRRGEIEDDSNQVLLFGATDGTSSGTEATLAAARQVSEERRREIEAFADVREPAPPRPLGVLVRVPEGWPA